MSLEALEVLDRARRWQAAVVVLLTPTLLGSFGMGSFMVTHVDLLDVGEELMVLMGGVLLSVGGLGLLGLGVLLSSLRAPLAQRLRLLGCAWWIGSVAVASGLLLSLVYVAAMLVQGF